VEEMGIWSGAVRVDVAVINGKLSGYELKSNSDTLTRLPRQIEIYGKVFDHMTLVVGDRHVDEAMDVIPHWWGCMMATMRKDLLVSLKWKRRARANPSCDPMILVRMLWKEEAIAILEKYGLAAGWRSKRSNDIGKRLLAEIPLKRLSEDIRLALKHREKLGQLVPSQLDMSIDTITDPACRVAGG
jgi:hypothetical protein